MCHPRLAHAESALAGELHFRHVNYYIIKSIDANQNNYCCKICIHGTQIDLIS